MKQLNTIPEYLEKITDLSVQNFEMMEGLYRSMTTTQDFVEINYNKNIYRLPSFVNMYAKVSTLENNFQSLVEIDGIGGAGVFVNGNNRKIKVCPFECKPTSIYFSNKEKIYSIEKNKDISVGVVSENLKYKLEVALDKVNVKASKYRVELYGFDDAKVATYDAARSYETRSISFTDDSASDLLQYIEIKNIKYTVDISNNLTEQYEFEWHNREDHSNPNVLSINYAGESKYTPSLTSGMILTTADRMASFVITSISDTQMSIASVNGAYALNEGSKLYIKNDITNPNIQVLLPNVKVAYMKMAAYADESNALGEWSDKLELFREVNGTLAKAYPAEWIPDDTIFNDYISAASALKENVVMNDYMNFLYNIYYNNDINIENVEDVMKEIMETPPIVTFENFDFSSNSEIDNLKNNLSSVSNKIFVLEQNANPTLLEVESLKQLREQRLSLTEKLAEASINSNIYSTNYKDGILKFDFTSPLEKAKHPNAFVCYEVRYKIRNYANIESDFFYYNTISKDIILKDGKYTILGDSGNLVLSVIVPKNAYIDYQYRIKYWDEYPNKYSWTTWSDIETTINNISTNIDMSAITANIMNTLTATGIFSHIDDTTKNSHIANQIDTQFLQIGGQPKSLDVVLNEIMKTFASMQESIYLQAGNLSVGTYLPCLLYYDEQTNRGYCWEWKDATHTIPPVNGNTTYTVYMYNACDRAVSVKREYIDGVDDGEVTIQPNERVKATYTANAPTISLNDLKKYPLVLPLDMITLRTL